MANFLNGLDSEFSDFWLSIFYTFMDMLLDYILIFFRGIVNIMNAPVFKQYRCVTSRYQKESDIFWMQRAELMPSLTVEQVPQGREMILEKMPPEPLAILQLVDAIIDDISVNQVQSHLSPIIKTQINQNDSSPNKVDSDSNLYDLCSEPTFCYFFIDVRSRNCSKESREDQSSLARSTTNQCLNESINDYKNNEFEHFADRLSEYPPVMRRQHSLSECSEDSFICFTDDSEDINSLHDVCQHDSGNKSGCDDIKKSGQHISNPNQDTTCNTQNFKKVRFNETPEIHIMHTWNYAYRSARKGDHWQALARDRDRFQQRIHRTALILDPILNSEHRQTIFEERFKIDK